MRTVARSPLAIAILAIALALSACQSGPPPGAGPAPGSGQAPADGGDAPATEARACPEGMLSNVRAGYADNVTELNADDFGGPIGFSGLTEGYRASCVFRYPVPNGGAVIVAYFMGESTEFVLEMASRLESYGFTLDGSNNDLPRDWSLAGLQVQVDRRYADDVSVPNTTFDDDFVLVSFDE